MFQIQSREFKLLLKKPKSILAFLFQMFFFAWNIQESTTIIYLNFSLKSNVIFGLKEVHRSSIHLAFKEAKMIKLMRKELLSMHTKTGNLLSYGLLQGK